MPGVDIMHKSRRWWFHFSLSEQELMSRKSCVGIPGVTAFPWTWEPSASGVSGNEEPRLAPLPCAAISCDHTDHICWWNWGFAFTDIFAYRVDVWWKIQKQLYSVISVWWFVCNQGWIGGVRDGSYFVQCDLSVLNSQIAATLLALPLEWKRNVLANTCYWWGCCLELY